MIDQVLLKKQSPTPRVRWKILISISDFFFHRYNNGYPHSAIISGDDKLIKFWKTNKLELYHLSEDLEEVYDLAKQIPGKTKELEQKLMLYIQEVNPSLAKRYIK